MLPPQGSGFGGVPALDHPLSLVPGEADTAGSLQIARQLSVGMSSQQAP